MEYTGERVVPWQACGRHVMSHHMIRYAWATWYAYDKNVADLGCGSGYGAYILSMVAKKVHGVEVDSEALSFADENFQARNLEWIEHDLSTWQPERKYSLFTCFEVLEHLDDPGRLVSRLKPMLWSIPINDGSRYHVKPYSMDEIDALMGAASHYQMRSGLIVTRDRLRGTPMYALGLTER